MAHPLRLRILRLCLDEALTNKGLADRLGRDPATVLHHVRTLVDTGFLVAEPVRSGTRGARERPYRATGKSWLMAIDDAPADARQAGHLAMVDAFRDELREAGPDAVQELTRMGLRLSADDVEELLVQLRAIVNDFASREPDPSGAAYGLMIGLHQRR